MRVRSFLQMVFVLHLALQLSGVTCLNELTRASFGGGPDQQSAMSAQLPGSSATDVASAVDSDGCPCHSLFSQGNEHHLELGQLVSPAAPWLPLTPALTRDHSFFHPPALLLV